MTRRVITISFEPSRVGSGTVANLGFADGIGGPGDPPDKAWVLEEFIMGAELSCPFAQRQFARGRDPFPSRDPDDYVLTESAPGSGAFKMELIEAAARAQRRPPGAPEAPGAQS